jgi:hypothetical protein
VRDRRSLVSVVGDDDFMCIAVGSGPGPKFFCLRKLTVREHMHIAPCPILDVIKPRMIDPYLDPGDIPIAFIPAYTDEIAPARLLDRQAERRCSSNSGT